MIQECIKCKVEFLTEADTYAVLPKPSGVELMCLDCIEKPLKELLAEKCSCASLLGKMSEIDKLKSQLEAANKIVGDLVLFKIYEDYDFKTNQWDKYYTMPIVFPLVEFENLVRSARQALAEVEKIRNGGEV